MQAPSKGDGPLKGGMGSLDVQGEGAGESQLNSGMYGACCVIGGLLVRR